MPARSLVPALLALLALAPWAPAMDPVDPAGTSWSLPSLSSKLKGKAKKIGKLETKETVAGTLSFGGDDTFTATIDGLALSGTWSQKKPGHKKVDLVLDGPSAQALADRYEADLEAAAEIPIDTELQLDAAKTKLTVTFKTKKKTGLTTIKLVARPRFTGTTTGGGQADQPSKVKARVKGGSEAQDLSE